MNNAMLTDLVEVRKWLRGLHPSDLHNLATGKNIWGEKIKRSKVVKDEAARQLKLRKSCDAKVRGCLKAMGMTYTGTGGWWIVPFVTPKKEIAFVNIAHGIAVATDFTIDDDTVEVMTVPGQEEGVKASGAAAWTSPDAGEGRNASSPPGWKQLICDIRCFDKPVEEAKITYRTVAYGLTTCYKSLGSPGLKLDEGYPEADPSWWHFNKDQKARVWKMVDEWMLAVCKNFTNHVPNVEEFLQTLEAKNYDNLYKLTNQYPDQYEKNNYIYPKTQEQLEEEALIWLRAEVARKAAGQVTKEVWVKKVYYALGDRENDVIGMRWIDYAYGLLTRAIYYKLVPVAESLRWCLDMSELRQRYMDCGKNKRNFEAFLAAAALEIGRIFCSGVYDSARELIEKKMVEVLYENGPIYLEK